MMLLDSWPSSRSRWTMKERARRGCLWNSLKNNLHFHEYWKLHNFVFRSQGLELDSPVMRIRQALRAIEFDTASQVRSLLTCEDHPFARVAGTRAESTSGI